MTTFKNSFLNPNSTGSFCFIKIGYLCVGEIKAGYSAISPTTYLPAYLTTPTHIHIYTHTHKIYSKNSV